MTERSYAKAGVYPATGHIETPVAPASLRRISWGAVLAGAVIAIAIHLILSLLGVGIGLSTVDPGAGGTPAASNLGIGAGIWWVLSNLVALVIGGYIAAHLSGVRGRGDGIIHGVLTWAVTLLVTIWLLTSAVGGLIGGAFNIVGSTLSAAGQGVAEAVPQVAEATGFSPDQIQERAEGLLRPDTPANINDPETARRELVAALTTMTTGSDQEVRQAREQAITIVSQQAQISPQQAEQRIAELQTQIEQTAGQASETATEAADTTANAVSSAAIWGFIAFLLGAGAGALGGSMGARQDHSHD